MHNRALTDNPEPAGVILRKLAVVFLAGLIGGVGFSFIGLANRTIVPGAFEWVAWAGLGLLSGFTSRRALRGHSLILRGLASLAAVIVAMLFVGWISGGSTGLVIPHSARSATDWAGLLQVTLAAASAGLALSAWNGHRAQRSGATSGSRPAPADRASEPPVRLAHPAPVRSRSFASLTSGRRSFPKFAERIRPTLRGFVQRVQVWRDILPGRWIQEHLPDWGQTASLPRRRDPAGRGRIRLLGVEEHRCPYCLDIVERRDPRGVVTCKVCHTRHHADCWAVAGMCQVPHDHR
jgi:hypothetical protein